MWWRGFERRPLAQRDQRATSPPNPKPPPDARPAAAASSVGPSNIMKANEAKLLEFFKKSPQFVIPIYQRSYSWGERECRQLWDDILRTGRNDAVSAHFVGSIVYVEKGMYSGTSQAHLLVS